MIIASIDCVPLRTRAGIVWAIPVRPPSAAHIASARNKAGIRRKPCYTVCDFCLRQERCREAVAAGDFIGCEWPLQREMIVNE